MAELGSGLGSSYPSAYDTDSIKEVNYPTTGFTYARAEVPNDLADAILKIQSAVGLTPQGVLATLSERLNVSFELDGGLRQNTVGNLQINPVQPISRDRLDLLGCFTCRVFPDLVETLSGFDQSSIPWTALSISPWVSPDARGGQFFFSLKDTGAGQAIFKIRRFGSNEEENVLKLRTQVPGKWIDVSGNVLWGTDPDQRIEYSLSATGTSTASFKVLLSGAYE